MTGYPTPHTMQISECTPSHHAKMFLMQKRTPPPSHHAKMFLVLKWAMTLRNRFMASCAITSLTCTSSNR